ncbi:MAG: glucose 1-dehydrogenase [Alphaproteobacteria bacterium]|nr:MAG: glucose 1-dehydrogenase [Alphaproteobacteria bacterium]
MAGRVEGKVALVTGAARGIGKAAAKMLAAEGAVVIVTDVDDAAGQSVAETIAEAGGRASYHHLDVTSEADWRRVIEATVEREGRLDILVNNAGICEVKPLLETSLEDFRRTNRVNAFGTFLGVKHGVAAMRASGGTGSIINISSVMGQVGYPQSTAYCASKGAVRLLTKAAALETGQARDMIRINSIHPGMVRTPMAEGILGTEGWEPGGALLTGDGPFAGAIPLERFATPEDVAQGILFLASDEGSFAHGTELTIDGGWTAK